MQFAATTDGQLSLTVRQRTYKQLQAILCAFILYTHDILRRNTVYRWDKIKIKNKTVVGTYWKEHRSSTGTHLTFCSLADRFGVDWIEYSGRIEFESHNINCSCLQIMFGCWKWLLFKICLWLIRKATYTYCVILNIIY